MSESLLAEWARLLFGTLAKNGVRDVVVSPGSRSTPFAWAALNTDPLRCHSVVDERSAGFFALGQARATGTPSVLLCTSGSAAAQYFPAVVEAAHAFLPLLVLTADRPLELDDCGAAQTMNQLALYGDYARRFVELGHPDPAGAALDGLVRRVTQAVELTRSPLPGPVHINARARKPLEPRPPASDAERALAAAVSERLERPTTRFFDAVAEPAAAAVASVREGIERARSGLIVCGPLSPADGPLAPLVELALATGFPLCVEAASQLRFAELRAASDVAVIGSFDALFALPLPPALEPECVLVFGAPPTSGGFERWAARSPAERVVVARHGWPDPSNRASAIVHGDPALVARALARSLGAEQRAEDASRGPFRERWRNADAVYFRLVEAAGSETRFGEASAVRAALACVPRGAWLGLGNSLPIRDVDAFVPPLARDLRVWSQRGLNGIDGLVSGAAGLASAVDAPGLTLLGDVSCLHDIGGLAALRAVTAPLALLVIDNGGGRIFDQLPMAATLAERPDFRRFWLTPPSCDFGHAAHAFGIAYERAETAAALRAALANAFARGGATLVHAVVEPDSAAHMRARLRGELATALRALE